MSHMKDWIVVVPAIVGFMTACRAQPTEIVTPLIEEVPMEEPFVEPTATPSCQDHPDVTVETRRISDSTIELFVTGLEPGEIPYVTYETFIKNIGGTRGESGRFVQGADEQPLPRRALRQQGSALGRGDEASSTQVLARPLRRRGGRRACLRSRGGAAARRAREAEFPFDARPVKAVIPASAIDRTGLASRNRSIASETDFIDVIPLS